MNHRKYIIASMVCASALLIDQATKTMIQAVLADAPPIVFVPEVFEFHFARNTGMAFGLLQNLGQPWRAPLFGMITLVAVVIIVHLLRQTPARAIQLPIALGLILSGAFGNLLDRIRWGYVVDFIRFQFGNYLIWPTFNLADTFITIGIGLLVLDTLFAQETEEAEPAANSEAPSPDPASASPLGENSPPP